MGAGFWWIVLIVAAVCAFYLCRDRLRHLSVKALKPGLHRDYLVGLNYLLNEEPDKSGGYFYPHAGSRYRYG